LNVTNAKVLITSAKKKYVTATTTTTTTIQFPFTTVPA
jgi:hypothetical protein